jgi:Sulfotransferase domain
MTISLTAKGTMINSALPLLSSMLTVHPLVFNVHESMGNQPSIPQPSAEFQVIGAGFARTGTSSFSEALHILLEGPVYHGGTQVTRGPPIEIRSWIRLLSHWPPQSAADKLVILGILRERFEGYVAATDAPATFLVPELMEVYPNAKVICTVRDAKEWEKSIVGVATAATVWFLRFVLFPLPSMRYFVDYVGVLRKTIVHLYGEREPFTTQTYHRHIAWLKETVPEDKLVFFDVKGGWEPLCRALGKDVPKDIPFPRINDGQATEKVAKEVVMRGLTMWALILAPIAVAVAAYLVLRG